MKIVVGGKGKCSTFAPANERNGGLKNEGSLREFFESLKASIRKSEAHLPRGGAPVRKRDGKNTQRALKFQERNNQ